MTDTQQEYETVTVNLIPKAFQAVTDTAARTGDRRTDVINRAVQLYDFVTEQEAQGRQLMVYDPRTKEMQAVSFSS